MGHDREYILPKPIVAFSEEFQLIFIIHQIVTDARNVALDANNFIQITVNYAIFENRIAYIGYINLVCMRFIDICMYY